MSDARYDPREIYRSIFGEKMRGHGQKWPRIDLAELRAINPETVGWIYMPLSPISYPVVKERRDPRYYLTHNFSGEPSIHGAICMDFRHGGVMPPYCTFFHGHHMKDWSMFMSIVELANPPFLRSIRASSFFWTGGISRRGFLPGFAIGRTRGKSWRSARRSGIGRTTRGGSRRSKSKA